MSIGEQVFPVIRSVFLPTDFSEESKVAFAHALKISLIQKSRLNILHVANDDNDASWIEFPGVRTILSRWGLIPEGSGKEAVSGLGIHLTKIMAPKDDPVHSSVAFLNRHPADLIVLAPHRLNGVMRWFHSSVSEPLSRKADESTLFVQHGVSGFVSLEDGSVSLKSILVPVDIDSKPAAAVNAACRLVSALELTDVCFTLLYVGESDDLLAVHVPETSGWVWDKRTVQGDVVKNILDVATDISADLIIMTTHGHDGFLDALRGSTTERVMRNAKCPLLALPAER